MQREIPLTVNTAEQDISGNERLINVYPRQSTGSKYGFSLVGTPGLAFFAELPTFPVLGLHSVGSRVFAFTPSKMYEIAQSGAHTELGDVSLSGRVSIEDNGLQVVVVDGSVGYYYDIALNEVKQITAAGFYPSATVTYQDGYFIFERSGTGQYYLSELLSVAFDPNDFATAEGAPDNLVAVLSDHREVFLFGTRTIQVVYNSGAADFPFETNQGAFVEKGCAAKYSIAKQDNTIFFVGSDLMVYRMVGYSPQRISNHAVELTMTGVDLTDCFAYTYQDAGQLFYVLTIPANKITWCYDVSLGSWHIRKDYNFGRHRSNCSVFANNKTLVGDFQNGRIYNFTTDWLTDDGEPIEREFVLPTVNNGREFLSVYSLELDMETGIGLTQGQGSDPQAICTFSKDNGKTWSNDRFAPLGKLGEYLARLKWNRFGTARQFAFKIQITDPVKIDIGAAYIEV